MQKIISMQMLDESWNVGTQYGQFGLSYNYTVIRQDNYGELLLFDITNVDIIYGSTPGGKELSWPNQQMVQIRLRREPGIDELKIHTIKLVDRFDPTPYTNLPCRTSIVRSIFRSTEWDYYGHQGTWTRTWHIISWTFGDFFESNMVIFIPLGVLLLASYVIRRIATRSRRTKMKKSVRDPEVAFLKVDDEKALLQELVEREEYNVEILESS